MNVRRDSRRAQSSLELLVTLSFGLIILLPIVVLAFIQISTSSSSLATTEAQQTASKLANTAAYIGAQGYPAKQLTLIQMPPDIAAIEVGTLSGGIGHEIVIEIRTNAGLSYVTAYSPVNVSGSLGNIASAGSYLVNISAQTYCPADAAVSCVYIQST